MKDAVIKSAIIGFGLILLALVVLEWVAQAWPTVYASLQSLTTEYGLAGTFVLILLGSSIVPFPTDFVFTYAAALSANIWLLVLVAVVASTLGALVNYALALLLREKFVTRFVKQKELDQAKELVDKYGPWVILVFGVLPASAFIDPLTFLAGLSKMSFKKFLAYLVASRVLHFGLLALIASSLL
ncbi:MAG: VTT domain-containing protein [Candidatus Micrarchaeota archaeon]